MLNGLLKQIEDLRGQLKKCVQVNKLMHGGEILKISRELDSLIVKYYKLSELRKSLEVQDKLPNSF